MSQNTSSAVMQQRKEPHDSLDYFPPHTPEYVAKHKANGHGMANLNDYMAQSWSTPRASDGEKGGPNQSWGAGGQPLPAQMHQASAWPTPQHRDKGGGSYSDPEKAAARITSGHQVNLQDHMVASWGTPSVVDATGRGYQMSKGKVCLALPGQMDGRRSGPAPNGSSATTEKRGAPNPLFASWLMGWPAEFSSGVLSGIQSFLNSRRNSSRPSSKRKRGSPDA